MESDEEMYITQNTFKSSEITESDIISHACRKVLRGVSGSFAIRYRDTRTCSAMCSCGNEVQR